MNSFLKANCIALYLLAVLALLVELPFGASPVLQTIGLVLLIAHTLEIPVAFKHISTHPGPLIDSIGLTLLFGFLHWMPLAKKAKQ